MENGDENSSAGAIVGAISAVATIVFEAASSYTKRITGIRFPQKSNKSHDSSFYFKETEIETPHGNGAPQADRKKTAVFAISVVIVGIVAFYTLNATKFSTATPESPDSQANGLIDNPASNSSTSPPTAQRPIDSSEAANHIVRSTSDTPALPNAPTPSPYDSRNIHNNNPVFSASELSISPSHHNKNGRFCWLTETGRTMTLAWVILWPNGKIQVMKDVYNTSLFPNSKELSSVIDEFEGQLLDSAAFDHFSTKITRISPLEKCVHVLKTHVVTTHKGAISSRTHAAIDHVRRYFIRLDKSDSSWQGYTLPDWWDAVNGTKLTAN